MSIDINKNNVDFVRSQMAIKNSNIPLYSYGTQVLTDYDHFPYNRYFRGEYKNSNPVVAEREAGFRPRYDNCYNLSFKQCKKEDCPYPEHCFESACSIVYPCYPEYLAKYSDREALNVMLNNKCTVQYR
jgi:hypothetical protein